MNDYEQRLNAFADFMTNPAEDNISSRLAQGLFHAPSKGETWKYLKRELKYKIIFFHKRY